MDPNEPKEYVAQIARESFQARETFLLEEGDNLTRAAELLWNAIQAGGKVLICGNGGSASDAQHMSGELVGKMLVDRRPLPAIALSTDTSTLTAVGNDFGFDHVFSKQIQALARKDDVLVAISTSGNSRNVLLAVEAAQKIGCKVLALTGNTGGKLKQVSDLCLNVSAGKNSCRIQETHIFAIHSIVDLMDRFFLKSPNSGDTC